MTKQEFTPLASFSVETPRPAPAITVLLGTDQHALVVTVTPPSRSCTGLVDGANGFAAQLCAPWMPRASTVPPVAGSATMAAAILAQASAPVCVSASITLLYA